MLRNQSTSESQITFSEDLIKRFEKAWLSGTRPDIAQFVNDQSSKQLLIELVHIDLEFRYRHQETPKSEEYFERFPELLKNETDAVDIMAAEFFFLKRYGHTVYLDAFLARFPQQRKALEKQLGSDESTLSLPRQRLQRTPRVLPAIPGYVIEEELGHGGMGVVYRTTQTTLQRTVAIKTLMYGVASTTEVKQRFSKEAEAIARLNHPNLVPVYEVGEWKPEGAVTDIPYFVMKYYAGGNLANHAAGLGSDLHYHVKTLETIAHAVHHAHQRGILHRDLKPSNILLDEHGEPHVADFGLAGRFDPHDPQSMTATIMGTPAYMAPEQAHSPSQVTTATDVYGLGAILYQLLTGMPPFQAETPLAVLDIVTHQAPVRPSQINPAVPRDLETICLKCLEKDPTRRYESALALAVDLERYRTGHSIMARPMPFWERSWRSIKRHPYIAASSFLTLAALVTSVVVLTFSYLRISQQEQETSDALQRERWSYAELTQTFKREQKLLYGKRLSSVSRLWVTNQLPQAWAELDACPEAYRGWEWKYYQSLRSKEPITISTPDAVTLGLAFLSDTELISADSKGKISIWDWRAKTPIRSWKGVPQGTRALTVFPQKKWVALCDQDNVAVWNYETQERLAFLPGSSWVAFSHNGAFLAAAHTDDAKDSRDVIIWDTAIWKQSTLLQGHKSLALNGSFSPDSTTLMTSSTDRTVRRWNLQTGMEIEPRWTRPLPSFRVAYLPEGKHIAEAQPSAVMWSDAETGLEIGRYNWSLATQPRVITARVQLATGKDPALLAYSGPSHDIQVWNIPQKRSLAILRGHTLHIGCLDFSPSSKRLASASNDQTIRIWELDQPAEYRSFGSWNQLATDMTLSPDGEFAAAIPNIHSQQPKQNTIRVWNLRDGSVVGDFAGVGAAAFTHDSSLITAQTQGGISCWNMKTNERTWYHEAPQQLCTCLRVGDDDKVITAVQVNGLVKTLDRRTGKVLQSSKVADDERFLGTVSIDPQMSRIVFVGHRDVQFWDQATRTIVNSFRMNGTRRIVYNHDGSILATVEADRVINIRNAKTGSIVLTFPGHPRTINALAFNADGKRMVTSCADGLIRIWDVETGLELAVLPGQFADNVLVTWDRVHDRIIAIDTRVHVWETSTPK